MDPDNDTPPQSPKRRLPVPFGLIGLAVGVLLGYLYARVTGYG